MVRPRKNNRKAEVVSFSCNPDVLDIIRRLAKEHDKTFSNFVSDILTTMSMNDFEYAGMMAKKYARLRHYWKGEKERLGGYKKK